MKPCCGAVVVALVISGAALGACEAQIGGNIDAGTAAVDSSVAVVADASPLEPVDGSMVEPVGAAPADAAPADAAPLELPTLSFEQYHSQEEIAEYLRAVSEAAPHIATFEVLGESSLHREIAVLVINATGQDNPPTMFANGTHHGDEVIGTEAILGIIDHLLHNQDDPTVAALLGSYAIYALPLVNPDGHAAYERGDAYGRDPNRDYLIPGGNPADYFRLPETRLVRDLELREQFRAAVAFHGGTTAILWPWGFSYDRTDDHDVLHTLSRISAEAMGFDRYIQSVDLYPAEGEYCDWAYMTHQNFCVTVEVSEQKTPPATELSWQVATAIDGTVAYLDAVRLYDLGELAIEPELRIHHGAAGPVRIINGQKLE